MHPTSPPSTSLTPSSTTVLLPMGPARLLTLAALLAGCPAPADNSKPPDADTTDGPSPEGSASGDCTDGLDNDQDGLTDCADEGCAGSADCPDPTEDADADGIPADQDCDDSDPTSTTLADDADCDGVLTADDCDDADGASTGRAEDRDCDSVVSAHDCDDDDPASTVRAEDGDCDSVLAAHDCDDGDAASTVRAEDGDCDGVITGDDCDDTDATIGLADVDDPDCDGVPTHFGGGDMIRIAAGTFDIGCTSGQVPECINEHELPLTTVTLTQDYYMGQTEVTQGEFAAVVGYNPSVFADCGMSCPVEGISWHEAAAFANAVSAGAGLDGCYTCTGAGAAVRCLPPSDPYACEGYRLPTEAEWEGAARCGEDLLYAGSGFIDDIAWWEDNSGTRTHPVAEKAPNACGLYDMTGNILENVHDWFGTYPGGAVTDPVGPLSGVERTLRGGGYGTRATWRRVATRHSHAADWTGNVGFRLARTVR